MINYRNTGIFLLLGTNSGNLTDNLSIAKQQIDPALGRITRLSSIYKTAAWGKKDQPDFLNQVVGLDSSLAPEDLLTALQFIEAGMGRQRTEKWGPRVIDLDILFYDQIVLRTERLELPHPGIPDRKFTLVPLAELAGDLIHPVINKTLRQLLHECKDESTVEKVNAS